MNDGTIYIGDGSWAVIIDECKPPPANIIDLFELRGLEYHVWMIELNIPNNSVVFKAITPKGKELTSFELNI